MRLVSSIARCRSLLRILLLLALSPSSTLCQNFTFTTVTTSLPWSPRFFPGAVLAAFADASMLFCGGSGGNNNDVCFSADSGVVTYRVVSR